ncbi:hypothetical protein DFH09DRAFT_1473750 [Mycena vulgaris]|nr:hypothetical protein DFH09DRAFT_1473750 [Mycena vulgaris]
MAVNVEIAGFCTAISRGNASYLPTPIDNENTAFPRACAFNFCWSICVVRCYLPGPGLDAVPAMLRLSALHAASETPKPRRLSLIDTVMCQVATHPQSRLFRPVPPRPGPLALQSVPRRPRRLLQHARRVLPPARDGLLAAAPELSGVPPSSSATACARRPRRCSPASPVASHPQSPAFSAPFHRDQDHHPSRYRNARNARNPPSSTGTPACSPSRPPSSPFTDMPRDALLAATPELSASQPSRPRASTPPSRRSHLAAALSFPLRASPGPNPVSYPTHALAIAPASKGKGGAGEHAAAHAIFPVHVVLAAHYPKLPCLPPSCAPAGSARTASATLPRPPADAPLAAPSPSSTPSRIPTASPARSPPSSPSPLPSSPPPRLMAVAEKSSPTPLSSRPSPSRPPELMGHAGHVKALWQDMVALGVYDPELWDALDLGWEALHLAAQ